ncbi:MAG TPA: TolC family protein [Kofleriaceae bacterium]
MMTRPIVIAVLGSLLTTAPAAADKRRRVEDRRSLADRVDEDDDRDQPSRKKKRVAQEPEEEDDGDGSEAKSVAVIKLDDLIEVAVTQSPDLARAKADRSNAKGQAEASRKDQSWMLSADATYQRDAVSGQVEVGAFQVVSEEKIGGKVGLGRNLPTGGNFSIELGISRILREIELPPGLGESLNADGTPKTDSSGAPVNATGGPAIEDTYAIVQSQAKATFRQPLVKGFGPDVALAQERKADLNATDATVKAQQAAEEMVRDVVSAYWELAYASYEVDTRAESLALAEKQEKLTRNEMRAGTAPDSAINAINYEIAVRQEALLFAKIELEKKSLDVRRKAGLPIDRREVVMRPGEVFEAGTEEFRAGDVIATMKKSNRRIASMILQKRIADVDVTVAKNAMLPQVDLQVSGALVGSGQTSDGALSAVAGADGFQVMAGLSVQFEISGAAKGAHDAALARRRKVEIDRLDVERTLEAEVVAAVKQVTAARARVGFSEKAINVAEDAVRVEIGLYQVAKSDNYKVMQRQTELVQAALRRGRAIADYHVAVAQLRYLSGTLLDEARVNVRPRADR